MEHLGLIVTVQKTQVEFGHGMLTWDVMQDDSLPAAIFRAGSSGQKFGTRGDLGDTSRAKDCVE